LGWGQGQGWFGLGLGLVGEHNTTRGHAHKDGAPAGQMATSVSTHEREAREARGQGAAPRAARARACARDALARPPAGGRASRALTCCCVLKAAAAAAAATATATTTAATATATAASNSGAGAARARCAVNLGRASAAHLLRARLLEEDGELDDDMTCEREQGEGRRPAGSGRRRASGRAARARSRRSSAWQMAGGARLTSLRRQGESRLPRAFSGSFIYTIGYILRAKHYTIPLFPESFLVSARPRVIARCHDKAYDKACLRGDQNDIGKSSCRSLQTLTLASYQAEGRAVAPA
jgi:hypothetical protein